MSEIWICFCHMESSPLPDNGFKIGHIVGNYFHWAVAILSRVTTTVSRDISFFLMLSLRALDIHIYFQAFCSESVITVLTTKVFFGQDGLYKLYSCMGNALTACTFPQPRYNIFSWNCNMNNARRISYYVAKTYTCIVHNFKI